LTGLISININHQINQKMNKLLVIYGSVLLSSSAVAAPQESTSPVIHKSKAFTRTLMNDFTANEFDADIQVETSYYVMEFNKKEPVVLNSTEIEFIEEVNQVELGFDTSKYLPKEFDPYADTLDINSVNFIEEEEIDLGFDTKDYLPEGFNSYETYFDIKAIEFIEDTEDIDVGFDTSKYLPKGFDPYADPIDLESINFINIDELYVELDR